MLIMPTNLIYFISFLLFLKTWQLGFQFLFCPQENQQKLLILFIVFKKSKRVRPLYFFSLFHYIGLNFTLALN